MNVTCTIRQGNQPFVAVAIHNGHDIREELRPLLAVDEETRLREEDPFTGEWTGIADNRIIVETSRFEVDLNRARDKAVYMDPDDAWGLTVWKTRPDAAMVERSLEAYDAFYTRLHEIFSQLQKKYGKFVVYDLHAYNHRREGPGGDPADSAANPEVNVGTGTMPSPGRWAAVIDQFIQDLSSYDFYGRNLDVRENVKFYGRQLAQWTHSNFPKSACVLSVEFKKFFMDEWTGQPDQLQLAEITKALGSTVNGVLEKISK